MYGSPSNDLLQPSFNPLTNYLKVIATFAIVGLLISSLFQLFDSLPYFEELWYKRGKYYYLIPTPTYHMIASLFLSGGLIISFGISLIKKWLHFNNLNTRIYMVTLLTALPFISFLVCYVARTTETPYFFIAPATLGTTLIIVSRLFNIKVGRGFMFLLLLGCILIPFFGMGIRAILGVSLLYPISAVWLSTIYGTWLVRYSRIDQYQNPTEDGGNEYV
ncbi:MAG: hypothetical protein AB1489_06845 [Acidobacteriota bacterium]